MATIWLPLLLLEFSTLPYGSCGASRYKQLIQHINNYGTCRYHFFHFSLAFSWAAVCVEVCTSSYLYILLSTPWGEQCFISDQYYKRHSTIITFLQLLDFPPILWLLDAHSLWHFSTIPLPLFWYRCVSYQNNNLTFTTIIILQFSHRRCKLWSES